MKDYTITFYSTSHLSEKERHIYNKAKVNGTKVESLFNRFVIDVNKLNIVSPSLLSACECVIIEDTTEDYIVAPLIECVPIVTIDDPFGDIISKLCKTYGLTDVNKVMAFPYEEYWYETPLDIINLIKKHSQNDINTMDTILVSINN